MRDLLRKRSQLVRQRSMNILSFKNLISRNLGIKMSSNDIKKMREEDVEGLLKEEPLILAGRANIATMRFLMERIKEIEKAVLKVATVKDEYKKLQTAPGLGTILALTIMFETGASLRFPSVGN